MTTTIMKEYNLKEIAELAKNYKQCKVEDVNGKTVYQWNARKPLDAHFKECVKRVNSNITPEGFYYFCFSHAPRFNKDSNTKYLFCKGTPPKSLNDNNQSDQNKNDLLSVTSALNYITQIAELKVKNQVLEMENKRLTDENVLLNAELEEEEREGESLSAGKGSDMVEYLKETAPSLMALADRFFTHQDKKLDLEQQKINLGGNNENPQIKKRVIKLFDCGSPEHLNYIKLLYNEKREEDMNKELNKLEIQHPEKYLEICNELNLFEDETTNGE